MVGAIRSDWGIHASHKVGRRGATHWVFLITMIAIWWLRMGLKYGQTKDVWDKRAGTLDDFGKHWFWDFEKCPRTNHAPFPEIHFGFYRMLQTQSIKPVKPWFCHVFPTFDLVKFCKGTNDPRSDDEFEIREVERCRNGDTPWCIQEATRQMKPWFLDDRRTSFIERHCKHENQWTLIQIKEDYLK